MKIQPLTRQLRYRGVGAPASTLPVVAHGIGWRCGAYHLACALVWCGARHSPHLGRMQHGAHRAPCLRAACTTPAATAAAAAMTAAAAATATTAAAATNTAGTASTQGALVQCLDRASTHRPMFALNTMHQRQPCTSRVRVASLDPSHGSRARSTCFQTTRGRGRRTSSSRGTCTAPPRHHQGTWRG